MSARDNISREAQNFLQQNLPCNPHQELTAQNIDRVRADIRRDCQKQIEWAESRIAGDTQLVDVAGVRCLQINPAGSIEFPDTLLLYFFGGGFITGSVQEDLPISASLASKLGVQVLSPCYSLAPENPYPTAIEQAKQIYHAVIDQNEFKQVVVVGESAGGNLALQTVLHAFDYGIRRPEVCVLLSPWVDLTHSGDAECSNDGRDPTLQKAWVDNAARLYGGSGALSEPGLSPLFRDFPAEFPPTLITSGTRDLLLSQSARLAQEMRAAGITAELRVWEDMWHVFEWYPEVPEAQQSLQEICAFISKHLLS
ncbi:MAG: alpha/beta hydrolase [Pseudomonadota bacterium]